MAAKLLLPIFAVQTVSAYQNCPILGPAYPKPSLTPDNLSEALNDLTQAWGKSLETGKNSHGIVDNNTAYSLVIFSADEDDWLYTNHHTPQSVRSSKVGTNEVHGDSIFRIGSISKLLTVYTILSEIGDEYWQRRLTDFLPELKPHNAAEKHPIAHTQWEGITLGAIASHLGGVTRDMYSSAFYALEYYLEAMGADPSDFGLPKLEKSEYTKCILNSSLVCSEAEFLEVASSHQSIYLPNTTPAYSNTGFQLLAYAVERITGKSFSDVFEKNIINTLGLTRTSYLNPASDRNGVIPGSDPTNTLWNARLDDVTPAGGIFSSPNDLAKIGRSILRSDLLQPSTTRGWLKPVSFTSSLLLGVGRPWEIYRYTNPDNGRVLDLYSKDGVLGSYGAGIVVIPDYGIGYVITVAGDAMKVGPRGTHTPLDGLITEIVLPAIENVARKQASQNLGGLYGSGNSTLDISTQSKRSGLSIDGWMNNGVDMLGVISKIKQIPRNKLSARLYPTDLETELKDGGKKVAFRAVYGLAKTYEDDSSPFVAHPNCGAWFGLDSLTYGDWAIDEFMFELDKNSTAIAVEPRFLRTKLEKTNTSRSG